MYTDAELYAIHISLIAYKNYLKGRGREKEEVNSAIKKIEQLIVSDIDAPEPNTPADYKIWESKN